jgi:hypothetical protein
MPPPSSHVKYGYFAVSGESANDCGKNSVAISDETLLFEKTKASRYLPGEIADRFLSQNPSA